MSGLGRVQYVRISPDAITSLAALLGVKIDGQDELVVTLDSWPDTIRPVPRRARDGRLIAGDPVVLDAARDGLAFEGAGHTRVLVRWRDVRDLQIMSPSANGAARTQLTPD
jgi:hypothetical protein